MASDVVALAAQSRRSPAFRIRVVLLAEALTRLGVRTETLPLWTDAEANRFASGGAVSKMRLALAARRRLRAQLERSSGSARTVLFQRQADLFPSLSLERFAATDRRVVLDVDDAIWHDGDAGGHALARLKSSRRKVHWLAERADVVIAGNDLLAEYLASHSSSVRIVPSLVDTSKTPIRVHADMEEIVLGWIGSATTAPFVGRLGPALARAARQLAPRPLTVLSVGGEIAPIPGVRTEVVGWTEATERAALARMDIGLMPLPDTPFTRGKCAYKALQYMAAGIPVVADDVGISARVIGDRQAGLVARSEGDWVEAIEELAGSVTFRQDLGREGRRRVETGFSYDRWLPELADILRGA